MVQLISAAVAVISFSVSGPRAVLSPTVRFVKSLIYERDRVGLLKGLLGSGGANKPVGITPLMRGSRPVWGGEGAVSLGPGDYWFRVGTVIPQSRVLEFTSAVSDVASAVGGSLSVSVKDVLAAREPPEGFCIKTLTPAQIRAGGGFVSYPGLHDLLRSPMRVLSRVLYEVIGTQYPTGWAYYFGRYYAGVKGVSRVVSLDLGKGREVRGVIGEWCFRSVRKPPTWLATALAQALLVAEAVGVGKSRATGLGQVEIRYTT